MSIQHLTENWETIQFPLIKHLNNGKWLAKNATLSNLKKLFSQENLKHYKDYVIVVMPEQIEDRVITVKFREDGQGLICLIKWIGSNYYREHQ
jgi:hypothetical protein